MAVVFVVSHASAGVAIAGQRVDDYVLSGLRSADSLVGERLLDGDRHSYSVRGSVSIRDANTRKPETSVIESVLDDDLTHRPCVRAELLRRLVVVVVHVGRHEG